MNPHDHLTEAQRAENAQRREALEREVERYRQRPGRDHTEPEPIIPPGEEVAMSVASVMPAMLAAMERQRVKWAAYRDSLRPQFDALPAAKPCAAHPAILRPRLFEETCQQSWIDSTFTPVWAPCSACSHDAATARLRTYWSRRGVPARVLGATLDNFQADTEERVNALGKVRTWQKRRGTFLLLTGTTGTGKGHLAAGCLHATGNGFFITHADMLGDLRASYTLHTTPQLIEQWRSTELLVLDEFGLSPGGRDEEPLLYQILAHRYENRRPTILTTNLELPALREILGYRLLDRLQEDCTMVVCNWASWRTGG